MGRIIFWSAAIVVVLIAVTVIATPWILRAGVPEVFAQFGVQATVSGGSLSLLRREITFEGLVVGAPEAPALSLGELGVGLGLRALVAGRIKLRHIRVKNVSIDTERLLALRKLDESGSTSSGQPLAVEFDEIALEDVRLDSVAERLGYDVRVDRLIISELSALLADKSSKVALQGTIGGGAVNLQLELVLEKQAVRATGKFQVDKVPAQGWARLAPGQGDPLSGGTVDGRGDIQVGYGFETRRLDLTLDGHVAVAGLGLDVEPVTTERGDANWQGRLALQWSPDMATPSLRGDGSLEVTSLHLGLAADSQPLLQASISDLSWHGDFNWRDGFSSDGAILGTGIQVSDASSARSGWQTRAEDFSWRLHAQVENGSGVFAARVQDIDLARVSVKVAAGGPIDIAADKVAVDEIRVAQSGDLVLGQATVDALAISVASGANAADAAKVRLSRLAASGLSGDLSGKLHAAQLQAESLDYVQSGRRVRAEEVDFASVGFRVPAWVGSDELTIKSVRADEGQGDIWLSGLKASKIHGDVDGRFGAAAVNVTHLFQSGSGDLSWDVTELKVRGIKGDATDTTKLSEVSLSTMKLGIDQSSWEGSGLYGKDVSLSLHGDVTLAGITLASLEGRQPSAGDLRVAALDARGLSVRDRHATLDGIKAATLDYQLHAGDHFEVHTLEARELGGDASRGLAIRSFTVAGGSAQLASGAHLDAALLDSHALSVTRDGAVAIEQAALQRLSQTGRDKSRLHVDGVGMAAFHWAPAAGLSTAKATLHGARFTRADGVGWTLAALDTSKLDWDGGATIRAERATLTAVSQVRGKAREWRAQGLRAADFHLTLPADVQVQTLAADSVNGGSGSPAWQASSLNATGLASSEAHGQTIQQLVSGALSVSDAGNGALLDVERIEIAAASVSALQELSAGSLLISGLRLRSDKPDWPGRLTLAQLQVAKPLLRFDGAVDLGAVVVTNPYLIVGREKDNSWILPPLPGAGGDKDSKPAAEQGHSAGGIRIAHLVTSGSGRVVYIDRATEPAMHIQLDPIVVAVENMNTRLPGSVMHFRARGTGEGFAAVRVHGALTKRVVDHDVDVQLTVGGSDLPIFNPYIALREDFAISAGRGDSDTHIAIENRVVSGKADVLLSGLEISSTYGGTVFRLVDPANFPIRTALAVLKDQHGDIALSIPLQARTSATGFDIVDVFQEAFVRTVTTAGRVAANLPGKTLSRAMNLVEGTISLLPGVDATRYAPVEFAYGADHFAARPLTYLDQLGKRMGKQPSLVLALCGRAVSMDADALGPPSQAIDKLFAAARKGVYPSFAPGRDGLLALAGARADLVRRYLRKAHQIPAQQLAACDSHIDDATGAKPRVDFVVKSPAEKRGLFGIFP